MADPTLAPIPPAPSSVVLPPGPLPGQPMQIMLPPPLQDVMQQFPTVLTRLKALEDKPASVSGPPTKLVAAFAYLAGFSTMSVLVFLWHYGTVIFRL